MKLNVEDRGLNAKRWALIGAVVAALGGCGGGGDEQLTLNSESASNAASAQGYVAVGQVVANAMVEVSDCRNGSCGACRMRCVSGQWRTVIEPQWPLNDGEMLACCSVPASNKLELALLDR